jgi:hypothetical protein
MYASVYAYRAVLPMSEVYAILGTVSNIVKRLLRGQFSLREDRLESLGHREEVNDGDNDT